MLSILASVFQHRSLHSSSCGNDLLKCVQALFPTLHEGLRKGECGRIAVIGGSQEYTGAPYFAAISALKIGADLAHVFCPADAATVIKSYSPELIVHPLLSTNDDATSRKEIYSWLDRLHAIVLGPGLGRNDAMLPVVRDLIGEIKQRSLPLIVDADGLYFATQCHDLLRDYKLAVLTPNFVEFGRLYKTFNGAEPRKEDIKSGKAVRELATWLGHVTIVQKGDPDVISDGNEVLTCNHPGSPRRCGGQGDLLSGSLATLAFWAKRLTSVSSQDANFKRYGPTMMAGYAACMLTRECSHLAYAKAGRTTTTSDLIDAIPVMLDRLSVLK